MKDKKKKIVVETDEEMNKEECVEKQILECFIDDTYQNRKIPNHYNFEKDYNGWSNGEWYYDDYDDEEWD